MPLTHYVILRRDLPPAKVCAQIVHAAGESAVLLYPGSSVKEQPTPKGIGEVGGSSPSSGAILPDDTIAVVLSVRNESRLNTLAGHLQSLGLPYVLVREPDMGNTATAIGVIPCQRDRLGRVLKDCQLFKPEMCQA